MTWLIYYGLVGAVFIFLETKQEDYEAGEFSTLCIVIALLIAWITWPIGAWQRFRRLW